MSILSENAELSRKLAAALKQIQALKAQLQQLQQMYLSSQQDLARMQEENTALMRREGERRDVEKHLQERVRAQVRQAEKGQREAEARVRNLEANLLPLVDSDAVRQRIMSQLEQQQQMQLQVKEGECARLRQNLLTLKRQNELLRRRAAGERAQWERESREIRLRHKGEMGLLLAEVEALRAAGQLRGGRGQG